MVQNETARSYGGQYGTMPVGPLSILSIVPDDDGRNA